MALGRGLGALITATGGRPGKMQPEAAGQREALWQVPITKIITNPHQPRKSFPAAELAELAMSIKQYGILQPLLVAERTDGGYELVAGERRLRAAQQAGLVTVPVVVKKLADQEKLEIALVENIQRQDLNPIEEAYTYRRLMDEFGLTQQAVADRVGRSRPAVANMVRLLELPDEIQAALMQGKLSMGQARALLGLSGTTEQIAMFRSMQGEKITVRELERTVSVKSATGVRGNARRRDPNIVHLENELRRALDAKAAISRRGSGGAITITYHSPEELSDIIKKIIE